MFNVYLNGIISALGALYGFILAASKNPDHLDIYIYSLSFVTYVTALITIIVSEKKDQLFNSFNTIIHIRSYTFSYLSIFIGCIIFIISLIFSILFLRYFSLCLIAYGISIRTFKESVLLQQQDMNKFWMFQLFGSSSRLIFIYLFIYIFDFNFTGLLLSNILASLITNSCYKKYQFNFKKLIKYISLFNSKNIFSFDGVRRGLKSQIEILSFYSIISIISYFNLSDTTYNQYMLASVPYITGFTVLFRQVFSKIEMKKIQKINYNSKNLVLFYFISLFIGTFFIINYFDYFKFLFPDFIDQPSSVFIIFGVFITMLLYPLTIGYQFIELLSKHYLVKYYKILFTMFFILFSIVFILTYFNPNLYLLLYAIVPTSILFSQLICGVE